MTRKGCFVKLEIEGEVVEEFFGPSFLWQRQQIHFHHLLNLIEAARLHRSVQALILIIKPTAIGWGQIEEIHRLLARFHADGKRSYAYLEHADNKSYYLAAGAQKIYLSPATTLELVGLRLEVLFFKKLLDYLGIDPEVVQIGAYKSAAEPFDREGMSENSREMGDAILTDLQERRKVLAAPSTLTGSIGVIGGKLNFEGLFAKVGINVDVVEKGRRAGYTSPARPFSAEEVEVVREQMRQFYEELFLEKVAEGRQKSRDSVRKAAEGRVWTGAQALELELLDQIGGLLEAFEAAQEEAGLSETKKARIVTYTKKWRWRDLFSLPFANPLSQERVFALLSGMWSIR